MTNLFWSGQMFYAMFDAMNLQIASHVLVHLMER